MWMEHARKDGGVDGTIRQDLHRLESKLDPPGYDGGWLGTNPRGDSNVTVSVFGALSPSCFASGDAAGAMRHCGLKRMRRSDRSRRRE